MLGANSGTQGSLIGALIPAFIDIALHKKFSTCDRGVFKRRWGHFLVMWGFVGAAITSGFAVVYLYRETVFFSWLNLGYSYPVPITHWVKWLGNISAVALVLGGLLLWLNRRNTVDKLVGVTTAFDRFFLWVVLTVIATGVFTEIVPLHRGANHPRLRGLRDPPRDRADPVPDPPLLEVRTHSLPHVGHGPRAVDRPRLD